MREYNQIYLSGHLAADPELRETSEAKSQCQMALAIKRKTLHSAGKKVTDYHRIIVYGKLAKKCAEYLRKGSEVVLRGRLENRSYENIHCEKRYLTEVIAEEVTLTL